MNKTKLPLAMLSLAAFAAGSAQAAAPSTEEISIGGVPYTLVKFSDTTELSEWTVPTGIESLDYLVVGGGGGGGYQYGGGGGGGIVRTGTITGLAGGETLTVKVGAGGAGSAYNSKVNGANGGDSVLTNGTAEVALAQGGGGGGYLRVAGSAGGCGGGGGQQKAGGAGETYGGGQCSFAGGGGAGAAEKGGNGVTSPAYVAGRGGAGYVSAITGYSIEYGAGGGGGGATALGKTYGSNAYPFGGLGGANAGNGATAEVNDSGVSTASVAATAGADGFGAGGGGGGHGVNGYYDGADGGSGIVILRYTTFKANEWLTAPTLTPNAWTVGETAGTFVAEPKYGTVSRNYTDDEMAALGPGEYTLECWVEAGADYAGLATNALAFTVLKKANEWTAGPALTLTEWKVGETAGTLVAVPKYGTVTRNYTDAEIAALGIGNYTLTCSVEAGDEYTGLDEVEIAFSVRDPRIGPTGEPDTEPVTYVWTGANGTGLWYDSLNWAAEGAATCFGYPNAAVASVCFTNDAGVITDDGVVRTIGEFYVKSGSVTLKDGRYVASVAVKRGTLYNSTVSVAGALTLDGASLASTGAGDYMKFEMLAGGRLAAVNGATVTVAEGGGIQVAAAAADVVIAMTNATFVGDTSQGIALRAADAKLYLHDCDYSGMLYSANADGEVRITGATKIHDLGIMTVGTKDFYVGPDAEIALTTKQTMQGDATVVYDGTKDVDLGPKVSIVDAANAMIVFQNGATAARFTQPGFSANAANSKIVIDGSQVTAANAVMMATASTVGGGNVLELRDATAALTVPAGQLAYCGNSDTAADANLPAFRFVVPAAAYAAAPVAIAAAQKSTAFYANTRIELDLTDCLAKGTVPLFSFANGIKADLLGATDPTAFAAMLKSCLTAYTVNPDGTRKDATARVTDVTFADGVIAVTLGAARGTMLFIR